MKLLTTKEPVPAAVNSLQRKPAVAFLSSEPLLTSLVFYLSYLPVGDTQDGSDHLPCLLLAHSGCPCPSHVFFASWRPFVLGARPFPIPFPSSLRLFLPGIPGKPILISLLRKVSVLNSTVIVSNSMLGDSMIFPCLNHVIKPGFFYYPSIFDVEALLFWEHFENDGWSPVRTLRNTRALCWRQSQQCRKLVSAANVYSARLLMCPDNCH